MSEQIYSLAYVSRSRISGTSEDVDAAITSILESARRNNLACAVTGALLYTEGWFAQILEGPLEGIELTFELIMADRRHANITVLQFHPVQERAFSVWSMAYSGSDVETRTRHKLLGIESSPDELPVLAMGKSFVIALQDIITRQGTADSHP